MKAVILDAYNVIHKLPELSAKLKISLQEARRALLNFMVTWKNTRGYRGHIIIVYDGQDNILNKEGSKLWGIKCIFTVSKQEADDKIISIVRNSSKPAEMYVISEDGKVANGCKVHGATIQHPTFLKTRRKKKTNMIESRSKGSMSSKVEKDIDEYYMRELGLR